MTTERGYSQPRLSIVTAMEYREMRVGGITPKRRPAMPRSKDNIDLIDNRNDYSD
jgi:hypothetical protein